MKIGFLTDIHLDFLGPDRKVEDFAAEVAKSSCDAFMISGDISTSNTLPRHLMLLEKVFKRQTYFVLGNHDFWDSSIRSVRSDMQHLSSKLPLMQYAPVKPYWKLTNTAVLVGHDGWYDALNGNVHASRFAMNDWWRIQDYAGSASQSTFFKPSVIGVSQMLAKEAVEHVSNGVESAIADGYKEIIILTHVPPFEDSHIYCGSRGDASAQPWFTSQMMGDELLELAYKHQNVNMRVFCGHTHGGYHGFFAPNLEVTVGDAEYKNPALQCIVDVT